MARRSGPSTAVSCISRSFRTVIGQPRLLYRARRSRHDRTRARASLQCRFRAGMHQSVLIYALREQHRVCSGSMNEPKLVDSVELEVGQHAEGAALSSRTACSGAFCASKQHQSILSSIQRHSVVPYASQLLHCVPPGEPKSCAIRAPFGRTDVPRVAPSVCTGAGGRKENVGCRGGTARCS